MAGLLEGTSFVEEIELPELRCYLFKNKKGEYIASIWDRTQKALDERRKVKIRIPISPRKIKIIDLMGNRVYPEVKGRGLLLNFTGADPVFLVGERVFLSALKKAKVKEGKLEAKLKIKNIDLPGKRIDLFVKNQATKKLFLKAEVVDIPLNWQLKETKIKEAVVNSGQEKRIPFFLNKASFSSGEKDYRIKAKVDVDKERFFVKLEPLFCPFLKDQPVIDGNLEDWKEIHPLCLGRENFNSVQGGFGWKLIKNVNTAKVYTAWDKNFFYFAAEVVDDKFNQPYTGKMIWAGDSILLAFDTLNDAVGAGYDEDYYEYGLALTKHGSEVYRQIGKTKSDVKDIRCVVKREGGKTYYEAAFPWFSLAPFKAEAYNIMGFNFAIMDNDEEERTEKWLELAPGILSGLGFKTIKNPRLFKKLILIPEA